MKAYLSEILIYNRAPFDRLDLTFEEDDISVLTGINGRGKTTILSYIVDSWHELIRKGFSNEYDGHEGTYYRITTSLFVLDKSRPSIVYIRYRVDGAYVDYLNSEFELTEDQYEKIVSLPNKIPFQRIKGKNGKTRNGKFVSENANEDLVKNWFNEVVMTSFPSFRYELPYYITDFFKTGYELRKENYFSGYLINPLVVVSGLEGVINWLLDLVLDIELYDRESDSKQESVLWQNVVKVLAATLKSKHKENNVRFGIGRRSRGASRISIVNEDNGIEVYPSIYGMSSGELAVLTMFVEIIRQADNLVTNTKLSEIKGIVLIDEIDKHLHIKLQKEVLPVMLELFPNIQFVISTHSPFLTMGLAENAATKKRTKIVDLDQGGMITEPISIAVYREVYDMMIGENENYKELYDSLLSKIKASSKPLVITEGKTDTKHIKNAIRRLGITDVDVEFFEVGDQDWGDTKLETMLLNLSKLNNQRKVIGVFDRDCQKYISFASDEHRPYKLLREGSSVYAFCIPLVNEDEYGQMISIEHYYHKRDLLKENNEHRRIFLGEEFYESGNSKDGRYQSKLKKHKIEVNGVVDEKVYLSDDLEHITSVAMTKDTFADLVCGETSFADEFDFSNFNRIIDILREIVLI